MSDVLERAPVAQTDMLIRRPPADVFRVLAVVADHAPKGVQL